MWSIPDRETLRDSVLTVLIAAAGSWLAHVLWLPAPMLTGPALATTLAAVSGVRLLVPVPLRDIAFLALGIGIGTTMSTEATATLLHWPVAFLVLGLGLAAGMAVSSAVLQRGFGFDRRGAVLASAPGHLSFVLSLGLVLDVDMVRVTIVQSLRLLALTLIVPVIARVLGLEITGLTGASGQVASWPTLAVLLAAALVAGRVLSRLKVPAAFVIGAMGVTAVSHGAGWTQGGLPPWLTQAAFGALGALIGSRFVGVALRAILDALGAGAVTTTVSCVMAVVTALPVAGFLGLPVTTVLAGFAPGGAETMIALGAVLAANPGFVAACHVARLVMLTGLIPLFLAGAGRRRAG